MKMVSLSGTLYVTQHFVTFHSKLFGTRIKVHLFHLFHLFHLSDQNDVFSHHPKEIVTSKDIEEIIRPDQPPNTLILKLSHKKLQVSDLQKKKKKRKRKKLTIKKKKKKSLPSSLQNFCNWPTVTSQTSRSSSMIRRRDWIQAQQNRTNCLGATIPLCLKTTGL